MTAVLLGLAVVGSTGSGKVCEQDDPLQDEQKTCSVRLMAMMMRSARLAASEKSQWSAPELRTERAEALGCFHGLHG